MANLFDKVFSNQSRARNSLLKGDINTKIARSYRSKDFFQDDANFTSRIHLIQERILDLPNQTNAEKLLIRELENPYYFTVKGKTEDIKKDILFLIGFNQKLTPNLKIVELANFEPFLQSIVNHLFQSLECDWLSLRDFKYGTNFMCFTFDSDKYRQPFVVKIPRKKNLPSMKQVYKDMKLWEFTEMSPRSLKFKNLAEDDFFYVNNIIIDSFRYHKLLFEDGERELDALIKDVENSSMFRDFIEALKVFNQDITDEDFKVFRYIKFLRAYLKLILNILHSNYLPLDTFSKSNIGMCSNININPPPLQQGNFIQYAENLRDNDSFIDSPVIFDFDGCIKMQDILERERGQIYSNFISQVNNVVESFHILLQTDNPNVLTLRYASTKDTLVVNITDLLNLLSSLPPYVKVDDAIKKLSESAA